MRYVLFALVFAAGCHHGESITPPEYPSDEPGPEGTVVEVDPAIYDNPTIAETSTEKARPTAKTVEWADVSTVEGATYVGDAIVVDKIFREDASDTYGVRVRLKNTTANPVKLEYIIRFYTRAGGQLAGHQGRISSAEQWTSFVIEPYRTTTVSDFCRIMGAIGFRLHIRPSGGKEEGLPDDPAKKEERRQQREAAKSKKE